jgi:hypothetical protein
MAHIYTLTKEGSGIRVEVHLLNPGDNFPLFGGSSKGLTVTGNKASTITRVLYTDSGNTRDIEWDLAAPSVWVWVAELIRDGFTLIAEQDDKQPESAG